MSFHARPINLIFREVILHKHAGIFRVRPISFILRTMILHKRAAIFHSRAAIFRAPRACFKQQGITFIVVKVRFMAPLKFTAAFKRVRRHSGQNRPR